FIGSEHIPQHCIINKGHAQTMIIKPHFFFTKFMNMHWNSRNKSSHNSFHCMQRYTPYSEKAQNMINSEGIKIITHLQKPSLPPFKTILLHFLPVICWETPVLSSQGKTIRWSTRLLVHMK